MHLHVFALACAFLALPSAASQVLYVDAGATGANDGANWDDAFVDLQSALAVAAAGDEIWVAEGTYVPGATAAATDSFFLRDGVRMYGGFAGTETSVSQRDFIAHPSVLSGDVGHDDDYGNPWPNGWNIHTSNSAHVVTGNGVGAGAVLDGFVIRSGSTGPAGTGAGAPEMFGGGLYNVGSSPTVENCTFEYNLAAFASGAAIYDYDSSPTIRHCTFRNNWVHLGSGAGIFNAGTSQPVIEDCEFAWNVTTTGGGGQEAQGTGIANGWDSPPISVVRCTFEHNSARQFFASGAGVEQARGAGISSFNDGLTVLDCVFRYNDANAGAAIFTWGDATIVDCVFEENSVFNMVVSGATVSGFGSAIGAFLAADTRTDVVNCSIVRNHVVGGEAAAIYGFGYSTNQKVQVANCIAWGNTAPAGASLRQCSYKGLVALRNCCVEGLFAPDPNDPPPAPSQVPGCIDGNPAFVSLAALDLHLTAVSPCVDSGSNALVPGIASSDLEGNQRIYQGASSLTVDMGAYEFASQPQPPCPSILVQPAPQTVFAGSQARFDVLAVGAALSYQWRRNGMALVDGGAISGASTGTLTISPASFADAGSYSVVVANACNALTSQGATLTVSVPPLGQVFCSGEVCPCGNDMGAGEGCENSSGDGGRLRATGSPSVAADDAVLGATRMPPNKSAIVFMGFGKVNGGVGAFFGDGLRCVVAAKRFPLGNTGANGTLSLSQPVAQSGGLIQAGATVHFQTWFRDSGGPCGTAFNTSNALTIDFEP